MNYGIGKLVIIALFVVMYAISVTRLNGAKDDADVQKQGFGLVGWLLFVIALLELTSRDHL